MSAGGFFISILSVFSRSVFQHAVLRCRVKNHTFPICQKRPFLLNSLIEIAELVLIRLEVISKLVMNYPSASPSNVQQHLHARFNKLHAVRLLQTLSQTIHFFIGCKIIVQERLLFLI